MQENSDPYVNSSGMLDVGDGHKLAWEDWGNPQGTPVLHLHGGPGGSVSDSNKLTFDPEKHRIIFYDQRGCGKSTPFAETRKNTTEHLVSDIEKLREHLNIEKMHIFGGSWGSTLALVYSIRYPQRVQSLVLWGIYLAREKENNFIAGGYGRYHYPEAWERFISLVPPEHQKNGKSITRYYSEQINSDNVEKARRFADEWSLWESSLLSLNYNKTKLEQELIGDEANLPLAKLETQYFLNGCYVEDNYILENIESISAIPAYVVQGRFDNCTLPISAYELSKAYGGNLHLQFVNAGHKRSDPELFAALTTLANVLYG